MSQSSERSAADKQPDIRVSGERAVRMIGNRIDSVDLFASIREITIAHGTDVYRLRLTSQNKLILTK